MPTSSCILALDQVKAQILLEYLVEWLENESLTALHSVWLYAVMARLDTPLTAGI